MSSKCSQRDSIKFLLFLYFNDYKYLIFNSYRIAKFSEVQLELTQFNIHCCLYFKFDEALISNIFNICIRKMSPIPIKIDNLFLYQILYIKLNAKNIITMVSLINWKSSFLEKI